MKIMLLNIENSAVIKIAYEKIYLINLRLCFQVLISSVFIEFFIIIRP